MAGTSADLADRFAALGKDGRRAAESLLAVWTAGFSMGCYLTELSYRPFGGVSADLRRSLRELATEAHDPDVAWTNEYMVGLFDQYEAYGRESGLSDAIDRILDDVDKGD